jgi:Protein tyrosine and serine/threonine kinase/Leucine rich repeat
MMQGGSATVLAALARGDLDGARTLRLPGLREFPREVFDLSDTLEVLDIGDGALTELPADFSRLRKLRVLFASNNRFERLPPALGDCEALSQVGFRRCRLREAPAESLPPRLRWLTLTDNAIDHLPEALGERPLLQKVMLAGNRLTALPQSFAGACRLELIRLSSNRLENLPEWLPELPGLAWAAWSGNPVGDGYSSIDPLDARSILWSEIELGDNLGEGASGRVHRALWRDPSRGSALPVAVKLFKGAMTSDGLPDSEIAACLAAGEHPHLIGAHGRIDDHPSGDPALLTPLLPEGWRTLAGPPDAETCSRDVYEPDCRLTPESVLRLARGIASATAHLHERGVSHGDLYAHNILWDGADGAAALTDFGAASPLPTGTQGDAWRRVEARAYGLLLDELLDRCTITNTLPGLRELAAACTQPNAAARPTMNEALEQLVLVA